MVRNGLEGGTEVRVTEKGRAWPSCVANLQDQVA